MDIISKELPKTGKVQIQFHGFGEKSKSFTIKGMSVEETFSRCLQFFSALKDSNGFLEIKSFTKNGKEK